jgi:Holliday junction DNA helicase RuvA
MLGYIKGKIINKTKTTVIVEAGGIGYLIHSTEELVSSIEEGARISLWLHTSVKENAIDLYGLENKKDLSLFEKLLTVPGFGPKTSIKILSLISSELLEKAILTGDSSYLTEISGIGKKNAEKIISSLQEKIGSIKSNSSMEEELEILEILISLGYSKRESRSVIKKIPNDLERVEEKIKWSIKSLGNK